MVSCCIWRMMKCLDDCCDSYLERSWAPLNERRIVKRYLIDSRDSACVEIRLMKVGRKQLQMLPLGRHPSKRQACDWDHPQDFDLASRWRWWENGVIVGYVVLSSHFRLYLEPAKQSSEGWFHRKDSVKCNWESGIFFTQDCLSS